MALEREKIAEREKERADEMAEKERERAYRNDRLRIEAELDDKARADKHRIDEAKFKAQREMTLEVENIRAQAALRIEKEKGLNMSELEKTKAKDSSLYGKNDKRFIPKLLPFNDKVDKIDEYLTRFEHYAKAVGWDQNQWSLSLSALLEGDALGVYHRLGATAQEYEKLRDALLKNFDLTEKGFKDKFRRSKPEGTETFEQFGNRLAHYFDRWIDLAGIVKDFDKLRDFLIREQFLAVCGPDLYSFLKDKELSDVAHLAVAADKYAETRGGVKRVMRREKGYGEVKREFRREDRPEMVCGRCKGRHFTKDCRVRHSAAAASDSRNVEKKQTGYYGDRNESRRSRSPSIDKSYHVEKSQTGYHSDSGEDRRSRSPSSDRGYHVRFADGHEQARTDSQNGRGGNRGRRGSRGSWSRRKSERDSYRQQETANFCKVQIAGTEDSIVGLERVERLDSKAPQQQPLCGSVSYLGKVRLPTARGTVNDEPVIVLRDTGCTSVVVRTSLVRQEQFCDSDAEVRLIDDSIKECPMAMIEVDCPFYKGVVKALCMESPTYDLIVGNVDGSVLPSESHFAAQVQTRAQRQRDIGHGRNQGVKVTSRIVDISRDEFRNRQDEDTSLNKIREAVAKKSIAHFKGSRKVEARFIKKEGLLYREYKSQDKRYLQLVVPKGLRADVMKLAHESLMAGHLGRKKTIDRIRTEFFWMGMNADITRFCISCDICQKTVPQGRIARVPLGRMPLIDVPFKRVAVDLVGPIEPRSDGRHRYILTMIDYATRYPEAVPLQDAEATTVAEALVTMFSRVGIPDELQSDCGANFMSKVMEEVSRLLSLNHVTTSPRHPIANGAIERFHFTMKQMLKKTCKEEPKKWHLFLPALMFAIREVPNESTGFSPFELLYGRTVRGPMTILKELWSGQLDDSEVKTTYQYVVDLRSRLEETCKMARENLEKTQGRQKRWYDRRARDRKFKVGDQVLLLLPTKKNKLLMHWRGPYEVLQVVGECNYKIVIRGVTRTYHANLLKKYVARKEMAFGGVYQVEEPIELEEVDEEEDGQLMEFVCPTGKRTQFVSDVKVCDQLDNQQKADVAKLLAEFDAVFTDVPGRTQVGTHHVALTSTEPVRSRGYKLPFKAREVLQKEIEEMKALGVVEPSKSPYSSPIIMVPKKDGSVRVCIDYRKINRITVFDAEPMPNMEEVFVRLQGAKYYSKFDLTKGYWQVPLTEETKPYTAFETPEGLFQFTVTPFGMVNSGATFCRVIRQVIHGLKHIESFVDDIWVHTETWEGHLEALRRLFSRLQDCNLTAKPVKCYIGYDEVECLGHRVGTKGLVPGESKVEAVLKAEVPTTKKQVRSFLGLVGFFRRFIPQFARVAEPLTNLTKKNQPNKITEWTPELDRSFEELKSALTKEPILKLPDLNRKFILQTDASDKAIGAILMQDHEGEKYPVAYASKKLLPRERNYSVIERECLAIVWGIEKFSRYLFE